MNGSRPAWRRWGPRVLVLGSFAALAWWVATPRYADYLERSKIHEVANVAAACKTSVAEFVQLRRAFPASAKEAGCSEAPTRYAAATRVSAGRIEVTIRNVGGYPGVDGHVLVLDATRDAAGAVRAGPGDTIEGWRCATNAPRGAYKYFPANCRQAPLPP